MSVKEEENLTYGQAAKLIIDQYSEVIKGNCSAEAFLALIRHWLDFAQKTEEDESIETIINDIHAWSYEQNIEEAFDRISNLIQLLASFLKIRIR